MPRRNEDDPEGIRLQLGKETEDRFISVATRLGHIVKDASNDYDDEHNHWDRLIQIDGEILKVEIKGGVVKMIEGELSVLHERRSKHGNAGWTWHSDANILAGEEIDAKFIVANMAHLKAKLIEHFDEDAPHQLHPHKGIGAKHYVKYRRAGNLDSFIWVPLSEIEHEIWEDNDLHKRVQEKRKIGSKTFKIAETKEEMVTRIRRQFRLGA